jgi:hypothetical protein
MDKMAIFVEGQTEQIFVERLVNEIAGRHRVHIDAVLGYGGKQFPRAFLEVHASRPSPAKQFYVLIYDSMGSRVLSDVRDEYTSLTSQGYSEIVAIRDVYPLSSSDIPDIRSAFSTLAPNTPIQPLLVLAVMEIEAWFIAEHTHFAGMHASLTHTAVSSHLKYDPATHDVQLVPHPAEDLRGAYSFASLGYSKSRTHAERTVQHLDYAALYLSVRQRIPDLDALVGCIDRFLR